MGFKFWKKETPTTIENYKIIKRKRKGGKNLDRQQRKLAKKGSEREERIKKSFPKGLTPLAGVIVIWLIKVTFV